MLDQLLRGLLRGKAQSEDQFINDVMTNRMFETDPFRGIIAFPVLCLSTALSIFLFLCLLSHVR